MTSADNVRKGSYGSFWIEFCKTVGVPSAVLFYFLLSLSPKLDEIIKLQNEIATILKIKNGSSAALPKVEGPQNTPHGSSVAGEATPDLRK